MMYLTRNGGPRLRSDAACASVGSADRGSALFHFYLQLKVVVAPGFNGMGLSGFLVRKRKAHDSQMMVFWGEVPWSVIYTKIELKKEALRSKWFSGAKITKSASSEGF